VELRIVANVREGCVTGDFFADLPDYRVRKKIEALC
jgi:hypothetical protein